MGAPTEILPGRPIALAFHKLLATFSYGVTNYAPARFERLLESLISGGWKFVSPVQSEWGTENHRALLLTFDDGYGHLAEILPPLMERYNLTPLVFMPSDLIGRSNAWDYTHRLCPTDHLDAVAIRNLADKGVCFGSHGQTHRDLTGMTDSDLKAELCDSRNELQDLTGQSVDHISYPFGRSNRRVRQIARETGYRFGYTMAFPQDSDEPLALGRIPVYGFDTFWSIHQKIRHGWAYPVERFKARVVNWLSGGTILLNRFRRTTTAG
jgi:peptidoglycan/xylan/chitin deacetylase (PgdA/CDA1 family)